MAAKTRTERRRKAHARIRKNLRGTTDRPRLCVWKSSKNVTVQIIDDAVGRTLVSVSTQEKASKGSLPRSGNVAAAKAVGELVARRAIEKGIKQVVFDRGGFIYHGAVKALAEAARGGGLEF